MNRPAMLARSPRRSPRRKLTLSLTLNFATRVPGAMGVLLILPRLRHDLGVEGYGMLLGALALGSVSTFLFGGFNTMGRRLIGEAHAAGDRAGEADAVASLLTVNGCLYLIALAATGAYAALQADGARMFLIAGVACSVAFANSFDNARAAYNEHYVTALLQIAFQAALIAIALTVPAVRKNPVLAGLVIQGHLLLASALAGAHLLRTKPHLLRGTPVRAGWIVAHGLRAGMAEGLVAASLALSVVWMQARAGAGAGAGAGEGAGAALAGWYATLVRLFQTLAVPVVLLLMPLSSYIRLGWHEHDRHRRRLLLQAAALGGLFYGVLAAIALALGSVFYIERALALPGPDDPLVLIAILALFAAVIAYRSHAMVAHQVSDSARAGPWLGAGIVASGGVAVALGRQGPPIAAVAVNAALVGALLLGWLLACLLRERG